MTRLVFLIILITFQAFLFAQKTQVTFNLDMVTVENPAEVGIRGGVAPLSWEKTTYLTDEDGDGVFTGTFNFETDQKIVEYKFVNQHDQFELKKQGNRILLLNGDKKEVFQAFDQHTFFKYEEVENLTFTPDQLKEDIAILKKCMEYLHPNLYRYADKAQFEKNFAELENNLINEPDYLSVYASMLKFVSTIKCSHTIVNSWNQSQLTRMALIGQSDKVPFTFKIIGDRILIDKNASKDVMLTTGLELLSLNGVKTQDMIANLLQYTTADGSRDAKRLNLMELSGEERYEPFDIVYTAVYGFYKQHQLKLKNHETGEVFELVVDGMSGKKRKEILNSKYPEFANKFANIWEFKELEPEVGYLRLGSFSVYLFDFNWKDFLKDAFSQTINKKYKHLVIDIRGNGGGMTEVVEFLLQRIIIEPVSVELVQNKTNYQSVPDDLRQYIGTWDKLPYDFGNKVEQMPDGSYKYKNGTQIRNYKPMKNGFKGKTYVLIDASNSSATHTMATVVKKHNLGTLIGQETGGNQKGINGGYMFFTNLPNTTIEVDIPVMGVYDDPNKPDAGISPDVTVQPTIEDVINKRDPELEKTLEIIHNN
ncbi:MAG: S41 family peptidase [Bacteroidota bacterium]